MSAPSFSPSLLDPFQLARLYEHQQNERRTEAVRRGVELASFVRKVPTGLTQTELV